MNAPAATRVAAGVVSGDRPEILAAILRPGVAAAVWRREEAPGFRPWIAALPPGRLPSLRRTLPAAEAGAAVAAACEAAGTPAGPERGRLVADAADLAGRFASIMGLRVVRLRLDVIADEACWRFHVDNVAARLLTTFRGLGTEYGEVRPAGDPDPLLRLPPGAAAIFRGARWPGPELCAIVHRSPPVRPGETRLLLAVDPA